MHMFILTQNELNDDVFYKKFSLIYALFRQFQMFLYF